MRSRSVFARCPIQHLSTGIPSKSNGKNSFLESASLTVVRCSNSEAFSKLVCHFVNTLGRIDAVDRSLTGEAYLVRPTDLVKFEAGGRALNTSESFNFFTRPRLGKKGALEPRVYEQTYCEKIILKKLGTVPATRANEYSLYLMEMAKEMMDFAETALSQNRLGLAMHFNRYAIEFSAKSILPAVGRSWPKPEHVSRELRQKGVRAKFSYSISLDEIAWDLALWANPPRLDLYGDPEGLVEPASIIPEDEVQMVRLKAKRIYAAVVTNFERLHLKKA
jgi:hypothetical protein